MTVDAGVAEESKPFLGSSFQATLRNLEATMRTAAANLEFEEAARTRDAIKRPKLLDLEFVNDALTPAGGAVDKGAATKTKADARRRRRGSGSAGADDVEAVEPALGAPLEPACR